LVFCWFYVAVNLADVVSADFTLVFYLERFLFGLLISTISFRYWIKCRKLRLVLGVAFSLVIVFRQFPFSPISLFANLSFLFFANNNTVQQ